MTCSITHWSERWRRRGRPLGARAWRGVLARFEESGLTVAAFCEREEISSQNHYRWQTRLSGVPEQPRSDPVASGNSAESEFIDLSALRAGSSLPMTRVTVLKTETTAECENR